MPRFYTVQETADILGFSTNSVYKFLGEKRLKSTRGNSQQGRFRIPHTSIEQFLGTTLSEEAVSRALHVKKRRDGQLAATPLITPGNAVARTIEATTVTDSTPQTGISVTLVRLLLLAALLLLLVEVATTSSISWISIGMRTVILGILFIVAYVHGGLTSTKL